MKTFLLTLFVSLILLTTLSVAQTTQDYWIKWTANPVTDSVVKYEVYLQTQTSNGGWAIIDGAEYSAGLSTYFRADVPVVIGQTSYSYKVTLPLSGGWAVAGIISNNGLRSVIGASAPTKLLKKPGKPTNVRIETTP